MGKGIDYEYPANSVVYLWFYETTDGILYLCATPWINRYHDPTGKIWIHYSSYKPSTYLELIPEEERVTGEPWATFGTGHSFTTEEYSYLDYSDSFDCYMNPSKDSKYVVVEMEFDRGTDSWHSLDWEDYKLSQFRHYIDEAPTITYNPYTNTVAFTEQAISGGRKYLKFYQTKPEVTLKDSTTSELFLLTNYIREETRQDDNRSDGRYAYFLDECGTTKAFKWSLETHTYKLTMNQSLSNWANFQSSVREAFDAINDHFTNGLHFTEVYGSTTADIDVIYDSSANLQEDYGISAGAWGAWRSSITNNIVTSGSVYITSESFEYSTRPGSKGGGRHTVFHEIQEVIGCGYDQWDIHDDTTTYEYGLGTDPQFQDGEFSRQDLKLLDILYDDVEAGDNMLEASINAHLNPGLYACNVHGLTLTKLRIDKVFNISGWQVKYNGNYSDNSNYISTGPVFSIQDITGKTAKIKIGFGTCNTLRLFVYVDSTNVQVYDQLITSDDLDSDYCFSCSGLINYTRYRVNIGYIISETTASYYVGVQYFTTLDESVSITSASLSSSSIYLGDSTDLSFTYTGELGDDYLFLVYRTDTPVFEDTVDLAYGAESPIEITPGRTGSWYIWIRYKDYDGPVYSDPYRVGMLTVTENPVPELWDWTKSNGDATAIQTAYYYGALRGESVAIECDENLSVTAAYIPSVVWNDMCDKVSEMRVYKGYSSWNTYYATLANTKMTSTDKYLTATRFNSLRYNVGEIISTGIQEVSRGDTVKGIDQITIMQKCNEAIEAGNG